MKQDPTVPLALDTTCLLNLGEGGEAVMQHHVCVLLQNVGLMVPNFTLGE